MSGHRHEKITFPGSGGTLSGTLQIPAGPTRGSILLAHCFTCSKSLKVIRDLATGLEDHGFTVLRFDFTGLGESEGDFAETTVTTNVSDIVAAIDTLRPRSTGPIAAIGHSLGGTAVLLAANELPDVVSFAVIGSPFEPSHVRNLFDENDVDRALSEGRVKVTIAGRSFALSAEFFRDLERHCTPDRLAALGRPLLVVHGSGDRVVDIGEGERIFTAAQQPKWFAGMPEADHLLTDEVHTRRVVSVLVQFLDATL